jgi:RNA polymerase sigma-70 factor (ECF subfamily)
MILAKRLEPAALDSTRAAFGRVWDSERERVRRLLVRLCADPDTADDLVQEVALRALAAYGGFRGQCAVSTWLYRIAVNVVVRHRARVGALGEEPLSDGLPSGDGPERTVLALDAVGRLQGALHRLPDDLRIPLTLLVWEGMKYREIAAVLEIPLGTVMSRLHTARQRLREELGDGL